MTRINTVPPAELCDQHLLAEWRELTRIPNGILKGKLKVSDIPDEYVLGKGHMKFFVNKLGWLHKRYISLIQECNERGFTVSNPWDIWPQSHKAMMGLHNDWQPTEESLRLNRGRIRERMPKKPRYAGEYYEP